MIIHHARGPQFSLARTKYLWTQLASAKYRRFQSGLDHAPSECSSHQVKNCAVRTQTQHRRLASILDVSFSQASSQPVHVAHGRDGEKEHTT